MPDAERKLNLPPQSWLDKHNARVGAILFRDDVERFLKDMEGEQ